MKKKYTREEIYDKVSYTSSLAGLAKIIREIADENGLLRGRTMDVNAERMAKNVENFRTVPKNSVTREFGLRQQALYILYYTDDKHVTQVIG